MCHLQRMLVLNHYLGGYPYAEFLSVLVHQSSLQIMELLDNPCERSDYDCKSHSPPDNDVE